MPTIRAFRAGSQPEEKRTEMAETAQQTAPEVDPRRNLLDLGTRELEEAIADLGKERFRARQLLLWVYDKGVDDFMEMSNVSKDFRRGLSERFKIELPRVVREQRSKDGTVKWLFEVSGGDRIESVLIPEDDRITLCVSSQVGCAIGCKFCATALLGLKRNLETWEIVGQILHAKRMVTELYGEDRRLSNIVFMGMGEPLQNWENLKSVISLLQSDFAFKLSSRKITVSSSGLIPGLKKLGAESDVNLALSLNASTDEQRSQIMPPNRKWNMAELRKALEEFPLPNRRKITIEYVMLRGFNDQVADAKRLASYLRGLEVKVNLIPFNEFDEVDWQRPDDATVVRFQNILINSGYNAMVRKTRGNDIDAACGMLQRRGDPQARKKAG